MDRNWGQGQEASLNLRRKGHIGKWTSDKCREGDFDSNTINVPTPFETEFANSVTIYCPNQQNTKYWIQ